MKKYEYLIVRLDAGDDHIATMDRLGQQGWEAFAVDNRDRVFFRREAEVKPAVVFRDEISEMRALIAYFYDFISGWKAGDGTTVSGEIMERARRLMK